MYLHYYHLRREPFRLTPDPDFFFLSTSHREALASIMYGVEQRKGFVAIIGEVGVGKTTILHSYLEEINKQQLKIIYIFNTNVSFNGLLKTICQELELSTKTDDSFEMVNRLHQWLIDEYREGRNVVLIIDEAQNMPVETLENLRMLSNLETSTDKLIQIVLVGQPELEQKLNLRELRQLNQRIAIKTNIMPLNRQESLAYIHHRLTKAASKDSNIFSKRALNLIVKQARGIPRIINILCGNALITGYAYQQQQISSRTIKEVIADLKGKRKSHLLKWVLASFAACFLIFGIFWISRYKDLTLSRIDSLITPENSKRQSSTFEENPVISQPENNLLHKQEVDSMNGKETSSSIPESVPASARETLESSKPSNPTTEVSSKTKKEQIKPKEKTFPVKKIVQPGDTLYNLVSLVYGSVNRELIEIVKKSNPKIKDIDLILVGDEIVFPEARVPSAK
jgi:general secretion pathway protein A